VRPSTSEINRLSEIQARALADWWGGRYQQVINPEGSEEVWHGIAFRPSDQADLSSPVSSEVTVFFLEDAQALENFRDVVNPGALDWVG
jgi:hypothetical protein